MGMSLKNTIITLGLISSYLQPPLDLYVHAAHTPESSTGQMVYNSIALGQC